MRANGREMFMLRLYEAMGKVFQDERNNYRTKMHARVYAMLIGKRAFSMREGCVSCFYFSSVAGFALVKVFLL